jgi:hypothetical protein
MEGLGLRPCRQRTLPLSPLAHLRNADEQASFLVAVWGGAKESNFVVPAAPALLPSAERKRAGRGALWQGRRPCPSRQLVPTHAADPVMNGVPVQVIF